MLDLVGNPKDKFSRDAAQIPLTIVSAVANLLPTIAYWLLMNLGHFVTSISDHLMIGRAVLCHAKFDEAEIQGTPPWISL